MILISKYRYMNHKRFQDQIYFFKEIRRFLIKVTFSENTQII